MAKKVTKKATRKSRPATPAKPASNGKSKALTLRDAALLAAIGGDELAGDAIANRYLGIKPYYGSRQHEDGLTSKGYPVIAESGLHKQLTRLVAAGLLARSQRQRQWYGVEKTYKRTEAGASALAEFRKCAKAIATDHKAPKSKGGRR